MLICCAAGREERAVALSAAAIARRCVIAGWQEGRSSDCGVLEQGQGGVDDDEGG